MKKHLSSVQFDTNTTELLYARFQPSRKRPAFINFLLKRKIAADEDQAITISLSVVAAFVIVGIIIFVLAFHTTGIKTLPVVPN